MREKVMKLFHVNVLGVILLHKFTENQRRLELSVVRSEGKRYRQNSSIIYGILNITKNNYSRQPRIRQCIQQLNNSINITRHCTWLIRITAARSRKKTSCIQTYRVEFKEKKNSDDLKCTFFGNVTKRSLAEIPEQSGDIIRQSPKYQVIFY